MFDVFYTGQKPNLFTHELPASSLADARYQSRTAYVWFIDQWNGTSDLRMFDFAWLPPRWEQHHTHIFPVQSQFDKIDVRFTAKEITDEIDNWHDTVYIARATRAEYWHTLKHEADWIVDPAWAPNPFEQPYIYVFGNPWYSSIEMPTVEYRVPGATEYKYLSDNVSISIDQSHWRTLKHEADWIVDPAWAPNPFEQPYIYVFGNPWYSSIEMPTVEYRVPGATEYKYMDDMIVTAPVDQNKWHVVKHEAQWVVGSEWAPNPFEQPYIYVFGNPWYSSIEMPTVEYRVPGATVYNYVTDTVANILPLVDAARWKTLRDECDWKIDMTWAPNPFEQPYIYVFGNPWYSSIEMPTVEYTVPGATEYKYLDDKVATVKLTTRLWRALVDNVNLESLVGWTPNPFEPNYIYVFGNQHYTAADMPTVEYVMPGATERKYVSDYAATLTPSRLNWFVPEEVNAGLIDFSWLPHPKEQPYVYHFSSEFQLSTGLTYTVPGAVDTKFETEVPRRKIQIGAKLTSAKNNVDKSTIVQVVSMFFVDMNNKTANARYKALKARYPDIEKIRFMNGWVETIKRILGRTATQKFWVISSENVYTDFNFEWHAQPWQNFMTHVFASQWQKWSDTFLINKREFERHVKWAKTIEKFPNLNFVKDQPVYRPDDIYDIYYIDHFNPGTTENFERIHNRYPDIKSARYVDNYLDTFKRIVSTAETDYIWITNSICDYRKFDFTWQPEPWQATMLHVFPSDDQKFGDTFYVHVPSFKAQMDKLALLDWYETTNFCNDQMAPRLPIETIEYDDDTVVDAIKEHSFTGPFAVFKHTSTLGKIPAFSPSIWRKKDRVVHVFAQNGAVIYAPRECKPMLDTQIYDYPYIMPHRDQFVKSKALDIVFISNGEPDEQRWYDHLGQVAPGRTVHWVKGVKGRDLAIKAAANESTTPWFFAVFAKLEVDESFDWDWQPDLLQEPKQYMFDAINPLNGLRYGHMGMVAYNKALVLATKEYGLDFTMSNAHESTGVLSGVAHYNVSPLVTWRTAFRECVKLKDAVDASSKERLEQWVTTANGINAEWSLKGAADAVEYYDSVDGNTEDLMQSFNWEWLDEVFMKKHG